MSFFFGFAESPHVLVHTGRHRRRRAKDRPRPPSPQPLSQELPQDRRARVSAHRQQPSPKPIPTEPRQHQRGPSEHCRGEVQEHHQAPAPELHRTEAPPRPRESSNDRRERKQHRRRRHSLKNQEQAPQLDTQAPSLSRFAHFPLLRRFVAGSRESRDSQQEKSRGRPQTPDQDRRKCQREPVPVSQEPPKDQEFRGRRPHRQPSPAGLHHPQPRRSHAPSRSISKMNTPELNAMYTQGMQPHGQQQVPGGQQQQFAANPQQMPPMQQGFPGPQPDDQQYGQQVPPPQNQQFPVPQQGQQDFTQPQPHENPLSQHPPNMQFGYMHQMPQMAQGIAQPQPFDQQCGQQIPFQQTPQPAAGHQHMSQMQHAGFVPQAQQAQFGTPISHGAAESYFQQGQQQPQAATPMGAQGFALGGQSAAVPPGAFPGDAAWEHANVSEINMPRPGGGGDREARRQERQRAQEIRDAELLAMDQQLEALQIEEERELQSILAMSLEEDEEQLEEQFRRDLHAQTIASRQHQMQDYERRREQFRQSQGQSGAYRVNMVRDVDIRVPYHQHVMTSLPNLQARLGSPVSLDDPLRLGEPLVEPSSITSPNASDFGSPSLSRMREAWRSP